MSKSAYLLEQVDLALQHFDKGRIGRVGLRVHVNAKAFAGLARAALHLRTYAGEPLGRDLKQAVGGLIGGR